MPSDRETYLRLLVHDKLYKQALLQKIAMEQMQQREQNRQALTKSAYETGEIDLPTALGASEGRVNLLGAEREGAPGMADALNRSMMQRFGHPSSTPFLRIPQPPQAPEGFQAVPTYKGSRVSGYQMKPKQKGASIQDRMRYDSLDDETLSGYADQGDKEALRTLQRKYPGFK